MTDQSGVKRLAAARIFVADLARAVRFYRDTLSLPLSGQSPTSAVFRLTNIDLIIEHADPADPEGADLIGRFTALSLQSDDCQADAARLNGQGVQLLGPAQKQAWGGTLAHFLDPDGNVMTLVEYPDSQDN